MYFTRKYLWEKVQKIKLRYLVVEILLIFIGVSLASYLNVKVESSKNTTFIAKNLTVYKDNLFANLTVNTHYAKVHKKLTKEYRKYIQEFKSGDLQDHDREKLVRMTNFFSFSNDEIAIKNIINKDINLIKNYKLIKQINEYLDFVNHCKTDILFFNTEILEYQNLIQKQLVGIDYNKLTFKSFKNITELKTDNETMNQIEHVLYCRELYVDDIGLGLNQKCKELIVEIKKYLN